MQDITIGRLRGGFCVYWNDSDGSRKRYKLEARTRQEAEAEAITVFRKVTYASQPVEPRISEIWSEYRKDLGDKPTATTMLYTGKAVLAHFGELTSDMIDRTSCRVFSCSFLKINR